MTTALILQGASSITVEIPAESITRKTEALATASAVKAVSDAASQKQAADALRTVTALLKAVEDSRKQIKEPVLAAGRNIDETARTFASPLEVEKARLGELLAGFERVERRKVEEAERARQAEIRRIEAERLKAEREAQEAARKAQEEAARIERERIKAQQDASNAENAQARRAAQEQADKLAREQAEARAAQEKQRAAEAAQQAELHRQHQEAGRQVVTFAQPKTSGMTVRERFNFEVLDIHELYTFDKSLVTLEPNRSEILKRINAAENPLRKCPALVIFAEVKVGVR